MPLTGNDIFYADASTPMSFADITAAMSTSVGNALGILQIVTANAAAPTSITGNSNYIPSTLQATITPISATSKILVMVNLPFGSYSYSQPAIVGIDTILLRNSAQVSKSFITYTMNRSSLSLDMERNIFINHIDQPETTKPVTYSISGRASNSNTYLTMLPAGRIGNITLFEIA